MDVYLVSSCYSIKSRLRGGEEKEMDCYLADSGKVWAAYMGERESGEYSILNGTKILQSFYYVDDFTEKQVIPRSKLFLLDSGAFTFFGQGNKVDWNEYISNYSEFIRKNNVKHFFELDIDSLVGFQRVLEMRQTLERLTNQPSIPVWHRSRGKDEFIKMCKEYDYVAIGGIVTREITPDQWKIFPTLIDIAHKHGAKIHGLGFTSLKYLSEYHFDSVDSTSWTSGNRFGNIHTFDGRGNIITTKRPKGMRIADPKRTAMHNFTEWKKFSDWAEVHL